MIGTIGAKADGWWAEQASAERDNPHWPDWRVKVGHARKRIRMASDLLDTEDVHAASEELQPATLPGLSF